MERARQYLKKLINLTVPVPEVSEQNSVDLSAGAEPIVAAVSPGPKRIRKALRTIPDACVPALTLIAAIWLASSPLHPVPPPGAAPPPRNRSRNEPTAAISEHKARRLTQRAMQ